MTHVARFASVTIVTFDAGGTLLLPHPSVGVVYRDVAARHGARLDAAAVDAAFRRAFHHVSKSSVLLDPEARERDFWRRVVAATLAEAGPPPADFGTFFDDVWEVFAHGDCWRLVPGARETLTALRARGYRLAVLSNWDRRLHRVLEELGLRALFEQVLISSEVGAEKPDVGIFRLAERAFGARPSQFLHVGDSWRHDVIGATNADWLSFLVGREDRGNDLDHPSGDIADLLAHLSAPPK